MIKKAHKIGKARIEVEFYRNSVCLNLKNKNVQKTGDRF